MKKTLSTDLMIALFFILIGYSNAFLPNYVRSTSPPFSRINTKATSLHSTSAASLERRQTDEDIRPLKQHWWPAAAVSQLDSSRPNEVYVLDQSLVLWKSDYAWACFTNACAHRMEPLSEGRVVMAGDKNLCLECSLDGWQYDVNGHCRFIPSAGAGIPSYSVTSYPLKEVAGIIWVYMDPEGGSKQISLPLSQTFMEWNENIMKDNGDDNNVIVQELPYGFEYLGESVLGLHELKDLTISSVTSEHGRPLFQGQLENDSLSTVSFYHPNHVRYSFGNEEYHFFLCARTSSTSCLFGAVIGKVFQPGTTNTLESHHDVLMKQWKMPLSSKRQYSSSKDYNSRSWKDVSISAFRRYAAALGMPESNIPRDRTTSFYESHVVHCPTCRAAWERSKRWNQRLSIMQIALTGAAGASTLSLLLLFLVGSEVTVPVYLLRLVFGATVASDLGVAGLHKFRESMISSLKEDER